MPICVFCCFLVEAKPEKTESRRERRKKEEEEKKIMPKIDLNKWVVNKFFLIFLDYCLVYYFNKTTVAKSTPY